MAARTLAYWIGILGVAGKGPNWAEPYQPGRTIGELVQTMHAHGCGEAGKRIEILKFTPGHLDRYNAADPYWDHRATLQEYVNVYGWFGRDIQVIFVVVQ